MEFEEFCKKVFYEDKDGNFHPVEFTEKQWTYINFLSWVKSKGNDTTLLNLKMRNGKNYIQKLYEEWIGENATKCQINLK